MLKVLVILLLLATVSMGQLVPVRDNRKAFLEKLAIEKRDKVRRPVPRPRIARVLLP